jgi:hypothetical protein
MEQKNLQKNKILIHKTAKQPDQIDDKINKIDGKTISIRWNIGTNYNLYEELACNFSQYVVENGGEVRCKRARKLIDGEKIQSLKNMISFRVLGEDDFYIIDLKDTWEHNQRFFYRKMLASEQLKCILKCQYNKQSTYDKRFLPYTYFPCFPIQYNKIINELKLRDNLTRKKKMVFRGSLYFGRGTVLEKLSDICETPQGKLSYSEYLRELSEHRILLSLPGGGNFSHREIEIMGIGTPVIMPKLINSFYDSLMPNYHYISVNCEETDKNLPEAIRERYQSCIRDKDFLKYVSDNALKWYKNNVEYPNAYRLAFKLLGLQ